MNVLFLSSYGKSDTRTSAFIRSLRRLANVVCVTKEVKECTEALDEANDLMFRKTGFPGLLQFVRLSLSAAKKFDKIDVLFVDNRLATIPAILIRKLYSPKMILQDARELYLIHETRHFAGKAGCVFEQAAMKKADIIFCANKYRAKIMQERIKIQCPIYVFENVFTLNYDQNFDQDAAEKEFGSLFRPDRFTLLSSSGCALIRTTDRFVRAMKKYEGKAELLLVGRNSPADEQSIRQIIKDEQISNVQIVGPVDKNVLKWMIKKCDAGIAIYGKSDMNNLYCASGKIYEFLTENKPIIASDNPPLQDLCNQTHVGFASDCYEDAIGEMLDNYGMYTDNVISFMQSFDIAEREDRLVEYLQKILNNR